MKKISRVFYYSILLMLCQAMLTPTVFALSESEQSAITTHCDSIKDNLKNIQKADSKTRIYLGGYYEAILTRFITPLNIRLVENNLSTPELIENQNSFADDKSIFSSDFIKYQQALEELISINCKSDPDNFYDKLTLVREKRKTMEQDVLKLRAILSSHVKLVDNLKGKL